MQLNAKHFDDFFRAIHGHGPFPWQQKLVDRLSQNDEWPDVLKLPTGCGKTAALDAAVFHLALRYKEPQKAALRVALVVDRRIVVDDAHSRGKKIAQALGSNPANAPVLAEVSRRLQILAGKKEAALVVHKLRGGAPLEHDWARTPTQPLILCSTVDQVGSRLLFRGYGVSNRMKPVHAGLLGANTLILLDEAHLSEPFRETLESVQTIGKASVKTALLSATPGVKPENPLDLNQKDKANPILKRRLEAAKPALLRKVNGEDIGAIGDEFADHAKAMAEGFQGEGVSSFAIGVVVNRVALARRIFERVKTRVKEGDFDADVILMIGRSRDVDRNDIVERLEPFRTGETRDADKPLFVVATQCLEVGVDLDLDGLITQAAPLDALRQRFGRLNRAGRSVAARAEILAVKDDIAKKTDDPVYGDRIRKTWECLDGLKDKTGRVDFGIAALDGRLLGKPGASRAASAGAAAQGEMFEGQPNSTAGEKQRDTRAIDPAELSAQPDNAPVLMPAYVDLWAQTSPIPAADPEVGLFLHGIERKPAEVSIVWRNDIDDSDLNGDSGNDLSELMRLLPPRAAEAVAIPLWAAKKWLRGDSSYRSETAPQRELDEISDAPERGEADESAPTGKFRRKPRKAFRWAGYRETATGIVSPMDIKPGDVLVVPSAYGGCDEFGWAPESKVPTLDVADKAAEPFRGRRYAIRVAKNALANYWQSIKSVLDGREGIQSNAVLAQNLLDALPAESTMADADDDATPATGDAEQTDEEKVKAKVKAVEAQQARESVETLRQALDSDASISEAHDYGKDRGIVLLVKSKSVRDRRSLGESATEDDNLSNLATGAVSLDAHSDDVQRLAERFSKTLGLPDELAADLKLAAYLHDAGKADERFQALLSGADPWSRPDEVLAKSSRGSAKGQWQQAGLPDGWRHEALSAQMAQTHPDFAKAHDPALVLYLIGTHHGFGRPFFNFTDSLDGPDGRREIHACLGIPRNGQPPGPGPQSPAFNFEGADWPRLCEDLKKRYGVWQLAHLEAILRLADHRASESPSTGQTQE